MLIFFTTPTSESYKHQAVVVESLACAWNQEHDAKQITVASVRLSAAAAVVDFVQANDFLGR